MLGFETRDHVDELFQPLHNTADFSLQLGYAISSGAALRRANEGGFDHTIREPNLLETSPQESRLRFEPLEEYDIDEE